MVVLCMDEYNNQQTDEFIKEIVAKYGQASVKQIQDDLGRYYYVRYTNKRVMKHCQSLTRFGELNELITTNTKGNKKFLYELSGE